MEQALIFLAGIAAAGAGYILKRWIEGRGAKEKVQEVADLVRLHKEMRGENVSLEAVQKLKDEITNRNRTRSRDEAEVLERIEAAARNSDPTFEIGNVLQTQAEMNQYAFHLADLAERELKYLEVALEGRLDDAEGEAFKKLQKAWRKYAEAQAEFVAAPSIGGSIYPLERSSELRALIIERAAKLKDEIRQRAEDFARS
jgi:uncharacterized protein YecT (DUF1311 family)